jgi:hypothetical protein
MHRSRGRVFEWEHSPLFVLLSQSSETAISQTLDEIHICVLANEHRRFVCFGPFSLCF